jgi:hypothetical protein
MTTRAHAIRSRLGGPYGARARCDHILPNLAADIGHASGDDSVQILTARTWMQSPPLDPDRRSGFLCPDAFAVRPRSSPCASFLGEIDPNALHRITLCFLARLPRGAEASSIRKSCLASARLEVRAVGERSSERTRPPRSVGPRQMASKK